MLDPVFPPKVKVGVGTVSRWRKCDEKWVKSSDSVQLQEVMRSRASSSIMRLECFTYSSLSQGL